MTKFHLIIKQCILLSSAFNKIFLSISFTNLFEFEYLTQLIKSTIFMRLYINYNLRVKIQITDEITDKTIAIYLPRGNLVSGS